MQPVDAGVHIIPVRLVRPLQRPRPVMAIDGIRRIIEAESSITPAAITMPQLAPAVEAATYEAARRPILSYLMAATILVAAIGVGLFIYNVRGQSAVKANAKTATPVAAAATVPADQTTTSNASVIQTRLQSSITKIAASFGAPVSISVYDLASGATASSNADAPMISASLYKLFVAESVYRAIDSGKLTYGSAVPGTGKNVADCLNTMITVSDNTCGEALGTLVGWERQNAALRTSGYAHTSLQAHSNEITSASDVALLLKKLYEGTALSPNSTTNFIGLLKAQIVNDRLPTGLPAGTSIAHKTGDLNGLVHDAGIVYGPKGAYVVSIMSGPWGNLGSAPQAFTNASQQIFQSLQ